MNKYPTLTKLGLIINGKDGPRLNEKRFFETHKYADLRVFEDNFGFDTPWDEPDSVKMDKVEAFLANKFAGGNDE